MIPQIEEPLETARAIRERLLALNGDLRVGELALQLVVLDLEMAQPDVAAPHAPHARHAGREPALHFREDAERDRLQDGDARARVHLRGDQEDVAEDDREEEVPGALAKIEDSQKTRQP